jgi:hypothetical protein
MSLRGNLTEQPVVCHIGMLRPAHGAAGVPDSPFGHVINLADGAYHETLPAGKKAANVALAGLRAIGERGNAQLNQWKVLANDFRGNQRRITRIVNAVQALQYLIRDPFGPARPVTTS